MSSIYLHQTRYEISQSLRNISLRSPKKMIIYGGTILVPIAVRLSYSYNERLYSKMLFFKTHSANSIGD